MKRQSIANKLIHYKLYMLFILFFTIASMNAQQPKSNSETSPYTSNNKIYTIDHVYQKKPRGWKKIGNRRVTLDHTLNSNGAYVAMCNADNSNNINENFYVSFGGFNNWYERVRFEVQKEGVAATRNGMFGDTSHLYLVSNWDNKGNEQDIIFGSGSNNRNEVKEKMRLSDIGNLGIGTSNPTERLHVKGNFRIEGFENPQTNTVAPNYVIFDTEQKRNIINGTTFFNDATTFKDNVLVAKDFTIGKNFNFRGNINFNDPSTTQRMNVTSGLQISLKNSNANNTFKIGSVAGANALYVANNGKIGMGTDTPSEKLQVDGKVKASGFVADASAFPDYVFANDYELMPLSKVKEFVTTNKHLPNMPSEKEVVANGLDLKKVTTVSVEKIEELYLYTIKQQDLIEKQQKTIEELQQLVQEIKQKIK